MTQPLLVFDLDGTLVDSAPDLLATLNAVLPSHGFAASSDPSLRDGIGHGARHLIEYALHQQGATVDEAALDAIHRDFLAHYEANICVSTTFYAGMPALLDRFEAAGWRFAVCTNKLEGLSRRLLAGLGAENRFVSICGGDSFASRKPDPLHLFETIAAASGRRDQAIMVGDSRTDLDTARGAGIPFVGVSFGYTPVPMAELGPDILIDRFDDFTVAMANDLLAEAQAGHAMDAVRANALVGDAGIEPATPPV